MPHASVWILSWHWNSKKFLDQEPNEHEDEEKFNYCQWDTTDRAILKPLEPLMKNTKRLWLLLLMILLTVHSSIEGVNFYSLLVEIHSLLVTRCKIRLLLVAEVARCKKSLVTRCRSCSLQNITRYSLQKLVLAKITRYSLWISLVTRCRTCSLQKMTRYLLQKLLVAKHHSLLVAEVARCKKSLVSPCRSCSLQKITRYPLQKLLVAKNHSLLVAKFACCSLQKLLVANNHLSLIMKKTGELMFI